MKSLDQTKRFYGFIIVLITLAAFWLRLSGISFGYPLPVHPDEPKLVDTALRMLDTGDLNPHFFNYPSLNIYIQAFIFAMIRGLRSIFMPGMAMLPIHYYMVGRAFIALLSAATVLFTAEIARRLFHPVAGLVAGAFLAVWPLHVINSYTVTVDSPVALFCVLATLSASFIYLGRLRRLNYVLTGVFAGMAISSKYTAFIAAAPMLIAHIHATKSGAIRFLDSRFISGLVAIPLAFLLTTPYAVLDFIPFAKGVYSESIHYRTGHYGAESRLWVSYHHYARTLWNGGVGAIPLALSVIGMLSVLRSDRIRALLVASIPVLLFLLVGSYSVFFDRNIVAMTPFLAVFAGVGFLSLYRWIHDKLSFGRRKRIALVAMPALIIASVFSVGLNAACSIEQVRECTLPDTRWECLNWTTSNLPDGAIIGREHYTPPVEDFSDCFSVEYLGYHAIVNRPEDAGRMDYMILSSGCYGRFLDDRELYGPEAAAYDSFMREHQLVYECLPQPGITTGPTLRIYRID